MLNFRCCVFCQTSQHRQDCFDLVDKCKTFSPVKMYTHKTAKKRTLRNFDMFEAYRNARLKRRRLTDRSADLLTDRSADDIATESQQQCDIEQFEALPARATTPELGDDFVRDDFDVGEAFPDQTADDGEEHRSLDGVATTAAEDVSAAEDVHLPTCVAIDDESRPKAKTIDDFGRYICALQANKKLSKTVAAKLVRYMQENSEVIGKGLLDSELKSFYAIRTEELRHVPSLKIDVMCKDSSGNEVLFENRSKYPKNVINARQLQLVYELTYTTLANVATFHASQHPHVACTDVIDFSVDDVPETISGGVSISVLSVQFTNCRNVYTVAILRPARSGLGLSETIILKGFLREVKAGILKVRHGIADAPKRAKLQGLLSHSANYCCQYCTVKKRVKGISHIDSRNANERTLRSVEKVVGKIEEGIVLSEEKKKGVKERSPLSCIPGFNYLLHVPAERMHLLDLGVIRKMISLMYKFTTLRKGALKRSSFKHRSTLKELNDIVTKVRLLSDFSRRARPLDKGSWKAQEYRNLVMCMFPAVAQTCPSKCKEVWLYTAYIYRALILPEELFSWSENRDDVAAMLRHWYALFESTFGLPNCSYNVHTLSHALLVRELGPLTETSAFRFEDQYQTLKEAFVSGTMSTGLQAMENLYLGLRQDHRCRKSVNLMGRKTSKVNDRVVYLKSKKVVEISGVYDTFAEGKVIETEPGLHLLPGRDFNSVLSFRLDQSGHSRADVTFSLRDIVGKCVECCGIISVIPTNVLRE